jgi:hypothetical protein
MAETADPIVAAALVELDAGGDPARAVAQLSASPDPEASMRRFAEIAKLLYRPRRNLAAMIEVARGGMAYGEAQAAKPQYEAAASALRLATLRLGYNTGANCWPGWGDEGVDPTPEQQTLALEMAERSLALRRTLPVGAARMELGHWLVGALKMSLGRNAEAAADFAAAEAASDDAGGDAPVLLARGYRGLAEKRDPATRERGAAVLADAIAALERSTDQNAPGCIAQLQTAERLMGK